MAQSWGALTDVWGDIPCSEALLGATKLQPKVDQQKAVYDTIQSLLDAAVLHLSAASAGNLTPATDDLVYAGDKAKWTRLAHSMKAKYYLHLRKVDGTAATKAATESALGLTSGDDAYIGPYGASSSNGSPWSQFSQQRYGELSFLAPSTLVNNLITNSDPRLGGFIDTNQTHDAYDEPADFFGNYTVNNGKVALMTYAEQLFINAELDVVGGNMPQAANDYNAAVTESVLQFTPVGVSNTAYLTANANETGGTITLNKVMTQKWIALFLNPEAFTDWRRTGFPVLTPTSGSAVPRRFYYPQQEISGNPNVASISGAVQLTSHVWWDL